MRMNLSSLRLDLHKRDSVVKNLNDVEESHLSWGHRFADKIVGVLGSWKFLVVQSILLVCWFVINIVAYFSHWDPYPFILLNLFLSLESAYSAPLIMMSQNKQSDRDRIEAHLDYLINKKAEEEIANVIKQLEIQNKAIEELKSLLESKLLIN